MGGPSGSGVATRVTIGTVAYLLLERAGYEKNAAGGLLAAGGLGAIISPPVLGAAAFLITEFLKISYFDVIVMATIPALLPLLRHPGVGGGGRTQAGRRRRDPGAQGRAHVLIALGLGTAQMAEVQFALFADYGWLLIFVPAAVVAAFGLFAPRLLAYSDRFAAAMRKGTTGVLNAAATCATAGIIVGAVTLTGLAQRFADIIIGYARGSLLLTAIFTAAIVWIVGLAVRVTASYIMGAVIAAPALTGDHPRCPSRGAHSHGAHPMAPMPWRPCRGAYAMSPMGVAPWTGSRACLLDRWIAAAATPDHACRFAPFEPSCPPLTGVLNRRASSDRRPSASHEAQPMPPEPSSSLPARGYFGIGVERISKALNLGNLMRSAHGFGASFTFTIGATYAALEARADTSKGAQHLPHYNWASPAELVLPAGCRLVGVELLEDAIDLPSFQHPRCAAYVLGRERGVLSPELVARCDYVVRIPTSFCINLAMAGAIVMYDRLRSLGRFPPRPLVEGGPAGSSLARLKVGRGA